MAEKDRIAIARKACLLGGVKPVNSFDGEESEEVFCNEMYEELVESELSLYPWRFATRYSEIQPLATAPIDDTWDSAHRLPTEAIHVDTVKLNGSPITYDISERDVLSVGNSAINLICKYRFRADETTWPPYFRLLIISRLAAMLHYSIARRTEVAESMNDQADMHWRRSKTADTQAQTNRKVRSSNIIAARRGGLRRFWRD